MIIHPFIFNWNGKYNNVIKIASELDLILDNVTVINSDDAYRPKDWINLGDEFYFCGQFNSALQHFSGDILFHIQGDVSYDKWKELINDAIFYMKHYNCGIYAPDLTSTSWPTRRVKIEDSNNLLEHDNLDIVSCPDETVWFIHKDVINKLNEYDIKFSDFDFGWGVDMTFSAISFLIKKLVLRDSNHLINHPAGTNYNRESAQKQLENFRMTLPEEVDQIIDLIENKKKQIEMYKYLM